MELYRVCSMSGNILAVHDEWLRKGVKDEFVDAPIRSDQWALLVLFCTCFFEENLHIFEVSIMHLFNGIFGVNPTFCYFVFSYWKKKTSCILLIYLWWFDLNDESATYRWNSVVCDSWPRWANTSHYLIRQTRRFMFIYLDAGHWFFNAYKLLQSFFRWSCGIWTSWQIGSTLNVHKKALLSVS